jgi:wyosine [tRNA(Phe)-imidazoG37] synthetase (radical SAM superfamily)
MVTITEHTQPVLGTNGFPLQAGSVYGPIHSRRYGHSLGINPLPVSYKFCDFDCVYCQYGWTARPGSDAKKTDERIKSADTLLKEIEGELKRFLSEKIPVDVITIAGNGEPTLHPEFHKFTQGLIALRDQYFPKVRIGILSDSSQCHRAEIKEALEQLDDRCMKLDAGDEQTFEKINRPIGGFNLKRTLNALRALENITIQSLFVSGSHDSTHEAQIKSWIDAVRQVAPNVVQVYTIDRPPADSKITKVSTQKLQEIANRCTNETGIKTEVFE